MHAECATERNADSHPPNAWARRRELRSVCRALARVPSASAVLDIPCGSGQCLEVFAKRGYRVTCVDPSEIALESTARRWQEIVKAGNSCAPTPTFMLGQPLETSFPTRSFDAVVCTGFFDRLGSSDLRIEALRELRRISRGPVIASFCNAFSLGALQLGIARRRSPTGSRQRIPVPVWAFLNDLKRAGLKPIERHAILWGISPLWHIVSVPTSAAGALLSTSRTGIGKAA
jgi:SAM-dependent methyltransferase